MLAILPARGHAAAGPWDDAARQMAEKIVATVGPVDEIALVVRNVSSLPSDQVSLLRRALETELQARGIRRFAGARDAAQIAVTLSENLQSHVLTAEMQRGEIKSTAIVARPRDPAAERQHQPPLVVIEKTPIFQQELPILDLVLTDNAMLVLDPERVSLYGRESGQWKSRQSLPLSTSKAWPRDLRGRLQVEADSFRAYLPGVVCSGKLSPLELACREGRSQLSLEIGEVEFAAGRNYFVGGDLPPFYSVAGVDDQGDRYWILAGLDGRVQIFNGSLEKVDSINGWGNDVAGINSDCGTRRQVLATLPTDPAEPGAVQAFEVANRQAIPLGPPVNFSGPVTAFWTAGEKNKVLAVSRNLRAGRYEAFHLSVSCSR